MTERLHHMIFHRRDADAKLLMYLAICEFVHPVHQEDAPGLGRHGVDGHLVESQQVRDFEIPFLRGRGDGVALFAERKENRWRGPVAPRAVDEQILGDAAQKAARVDEPVALLASCRARENLRSEEHTSELQSLMRISYAVFCLKKKKKT